MLAVLDRIGLAAAQRVGFIGIGALLCLAATITADVVLRGFFNRPIDGLAELAELAVAVAVAACFPAASSERSHLRIELLSDKFRAGTLSTLTAAGDLLLLLILALLAWRLGLRSAEMVTRHETSIIFGWPIGPFWWAAAAAAAYAALLQAVVAWRAVLDATRSPAKRGAVPLACLAGTIAILLFLYADAGGVTGDLLRVHPAVLALAMFAAMWVLVIHLVPLGAAMALTGIVGLAIVAGPRQSLQSLATTTIDILSNRQIAVIPMFLLMGSFAAVAGLGGDIYRLAQALLRPFRGGLAIATIFGCAGFGSVTGSSLATAVTIGHVSAPEMLSRGYAGGLVGGSIAAGGTLGQMIPPSTAIVLYAILTDVSIGRLFIAILVPALLSVALLTLTVSVVVRVDPRSAGAVAPIGWGEVGSAARGASGAAVVFAIVIGGLYGGIFDAAEAASVGAMATFLFALVRGKLNRANLWQLMGETASRTAMIYLLIVGASVFAFFIGLTQLPQNMLDAVAGAGLQPWLVVALLLAVYVILGCVMDPYAIMLITVPIVTPLILSYGFDLVWWGIVMVVVVEIGLITPPFGMNLFVIKPMLPKVSFGAICRGVSPFVGALTLLLAIVTLWPELSLWLPRTMR